MYANFPNPSKKLLGLQLSLLDDPRVGDNKIFAIATKEPHFSQVRKEVTVCLVIKFVFNITKAERLEKLMRVLTGVL